LVRELAVRFRYFGVELEAFDHEYNTTALNERAVEIPIAFDWLPPSGHIGGLEVGNVMGHYGYHGHRVVDLYEQGDGVDNIDVFDIGGRYEWILSVSTLEHIADAVKALDHLRDLLMPSGRMLITIGSGQHQALDEYLATGAGTERCCTLVRSGGTWVQTAELTFLPYGTSTKWAESVFVGEWEAS
jgi:hypothetical protein